MVPDRQNSKLAKQAGIYLHIPFCIVKCPYCDFYSIENEEDDLDSREHFVKALIKEIGDSTFAGAGISTIYFGGGTPSMLEGKQIDRILSCLRDNFDLNADAEITLELNPGEIDIERLADYRDSGVNRLSMGAQSFQSEELKTLGRLHQPEDVFKAAEMIGQAGFDNFNIDLMYAVPGQTLESVSENVLSAVDLEPKHISVYSLTYEKGTPFYTMKLDGVLSPVDENLERNMSDSVIDILGRSGFERYEISNYSLEGFESKHNSSYWNGSPYYSFGPSAHSFDGADRWWNIRDVGAYVKKINSNESAIAGKESLSEEQLIFERILLRLRTCSGLHIPSFESEFELKFSEKFQRQINELDKMNKNGDQPMYSYVDSYFRLTGRGLRYSDEISELFAP